MKKSILLLLSMSICGVLSSCEEEVDLERDSFTNIEKLNLNQTDVLKKKFGRALALSLNESQDLRELIKSESLKMFNNDYEVLYKSIKYFTIENNKTVSSLISEHFENKDDLKTLEILLPSLTILVPELPENSFSAELWNTDISPSVAIRLTNYNEVPLYSQSGEEQLIAGGLVPSFPVIVIKNNERIITKNDIRYSKIKTREIVMSDGTIFKFTDNCFDGEFNNTFTHRAIPRGAIEPEIKEAYEINLTSGGWHRDYIYYGIEPTAPNGPFSYDFQEHITSIRLQGATPLAAYTHVSDQSDDPKIKQPITSPNSSHWTSGFFEFRFNITLSSENGGGITLEKQLNLTPADLFELTYKRSGIFYVLDQIELKEKSLSLPLFNWDLDQLASTIKIYVEEVDDTEVITTTESRSVEYATNFGFEPSFNQIVKLGLKFGASQKITSSGSIQIVKTLQSDPLGETLVNFADDVVINFINIGFGSTPNFYVTRQYSTGFCTLSVEPKRVQ